MSATSCHDQIYFLKSVLNWEAFPFVVSELWLVTGNGSKIAIGGPLEVSTDRRNPQIGYSALP